MECIKCGNKKTYVKNSRPTYEDTIIRRRVCSKCGNDFRTYELSEADILDYVIPQYQSTIMDVKVRWKK